MDFEKDLAIIKEKLEGYKNDGYDRIHISGGTSKDGEHYTGIIGYYFDLQTKKIYFVGLPYKSKFHINEDKNGHTKRYGETPLETVIREFFEETGFIVQPEDLVLLYSFEIDDNRSERKGMKHTKYFYLVDIKKCAGTLFDFEGPNPIDGETAAPVLIPARLFTEVVFKGHLVAVNKAIEKLRAVSMEYYNAL